jgi:L-alanine-DL-glutamate epimerase-like enolase superfamily enzyme
MTATATRADVTVERVAARVFRIPLDEPESDGTFTWSATTMVVVEVDAGGSRGIGWTYSSAAAARLVRDELAGSVCGLDALDPRACHDAMAARLRNEGLPGIGAAALSAVDIALWDLKARILDVSLLSLLGAARDAVPGYGSGGFTSLTDAELTGQLGGWAADGFTAVKMKVGRDPGDDLRRAAVARDAIGPDVELYVDANGAYDRGQALGLAEAFRDLGVTWFEEPVSSDDLDGLRLLRDRAPAGMRIAAGEYGWTPWGLRLLLDAGAVHVLQADATRCGGVTGFMTAAAMCEAACLPLSAHTAPTVHSHLCCAASRGISVEWFADHVAIEQLLLDGAAAAEDGLLMPDRGRPGLGVELRESDAARYLIEGG